MKSLLVMGCAMMAAQSATALPVLVSYSRTPATALSQTTHASASLSSSLVNTLPHDIVTFYSKTRSPSFTEKRRRTFVIISTSQTVYPVLSTLMNQAASWLSLHTGYHTPSKITTQTQTEAESKHETEVARALLGLQKVTQAQDVQRRPGTVVKRHIRVIEVTVTFRTLLVQMLTLSLLVLTTVLFLCVWLRCSLTCLPQTNGDLDIEFHVNEKEEDENEVVVMDHAGAILGLETKQMVKLASKFESKQKPVIVFV